MIFIGSFQSLISGTKIFGDIYDASNYMQLQKNTRDNLSKELEASKYTPEDVPSFRMFKEENIIVHTEGMHMMYFAKKSEYDSVHESNPTIKEQDVKEKKEKEEYFKYCLRVERIFTMFGRTVTVWSVRVYSSPQRRGSAWGADIFYATAVFAGIVVIWMWATELTIMFALNVWSMVLSVSRLRTSLLWILTQVFSPFETTTSPFKQPDYKVPAHSIDHAVLPFNERYVENIVIMVGAPVRPP